MVCLRCHRRCFSGTRTHSGHGVGLIVASAEVMRLGSAILEVT